MRKTLQILGIRGIPASHGGFETFAEILALHLVTQGWDVTVYCQEEECTQLHETYWNGITRIHVPARGKGAWSTIDFDWKCAKLARSRSQPILLLGYNTALFMGLVKGKRLPLIINMDGIEYKREKWNMIEKIWLYVNQWAAKCFSTHMVADHPQIETHLRTPCALSPVTMIPYGAHHISDADKTVLEAYGAVAGNFSTVIARPEPENNVLTIVKAFSSIPRQHKLIVLGQYNENNSYHREVRRHANENVIFPGAIYELPITQALRYHSTLYFHGHSVGGTNPSLVEAMGAGNAIIAHDNPFNRWVLGEEQSCYFKDEAELSKRMAFYLHDVDERHKLSKHNKARFNDHFTWPHILAQYETLLEDAQ